MQLENIARTSPPLQRLLQQSRRFRALEDALKSRLPPPVAARCRAACIDEDGRLLLHADNGMAASRLNMLLPALLPHLQTLAPELTGACAKVVPHSPPPPPVKRLAIGAAALDEFERTADKVAHHPELAAALRRLAQRHR